MAGVNEDDATVGQSAAGFERALAIGVFVLKGGNIVQMLVMLVITTHSLLRPWAAWLAGAAFTAAAVNLGVTSTRRRRLDRGAVVLDIVVTGAVLLAAPFFRPSNGPWPRWPYEISYLVPAELAVVAGIWAGLSIAAVYLVITASWGLAGAPAETMIGSLVGVVPYVGFVVGGSVCFSALRTLAKLADERASKIHALEQERTRRILHTPYRLLGELADILRRQGMTTMTSAGDPSNVYRDARLAEALASLREIEAVVRGTEPASANLAQDLLRLREQFADLPLLVDVERVQVELPPFVVYRLREAVRSALQNVRLHAQAGEVVLTAETTSQAWAVSIHDDGIGFDATARRRGVGIADLVVRATEEIGGLAHVHSSPGEGTFIELTGRNEWSESPLANGSESSLSTTIRSSRRA